MLTYTTTPLSKTVSSTKVMVVVKAVTPAIPRHSPGVVFIKIFATFSDSNRMRALGVAKSAPKLLLRG